MKFNIPVEHFVNYLTKLSLVIPTKSTLPILDNILFQLEGNQLKLHSTDLENYITASVKVEGVEDGSCAIPAKKLLDLVRLLVSKMENVTIQVNYAKDDYDKLNKEIIISEVFKGKLNYDYTAERLYFKGILTEEDSKKILDSASSELPEDQSNEKQVPKYLNEAIEMIFEESERISKKLFSKKKVKVESNEKNKVVITTANGKFSLFGESADDYPLADEKNDLNKIEIQGAYLKRFVGKVRHAANTDEIKRNMAGILFDIRKDELRLVATDGFRLGKIILKNFSHNNPKDDKFIIPSRAADIISKLIEDGLCNLEYDETILKLVTGNLEIYCKLVDDTYPNYETVIPKNNDKKLKVERGEFIGALRRASIFVDPGTKRVKIEAKNTVMTIKADNPELGSEGEEVIDCSFVSNDKIDFDAEPFSISFNVIYLLDCLSVVETDSIIISFSLPSKASIVVPTEQPNNEDYMELVMPVRVG